jgi:hypothetical protein
MKHQTLIFLLIIFLFSSCTEQYNVDHSTISKFFSGKIIYETISGSNTDEGKYKIYRVTFENENLYDHYLVDKKAIANACAIYIKHDNPDIFRYLDKIEIKITKENNLISESVYTAVYDSTSIASYYDDFFYREKILASFLKNVKERDLDSIKLVAPNLIEITKDNKTFIESLNEDLPDSIIKVNAIGYRKVFNSKNKELKEVIIMTEYKNEYSLFQFKTMNESKYFEIVGFKY